MSTERMQLSERESCQESGKLQSSIAESEIEEDEIWQEYKK